MNLLTEKVKLNKVLWKELLVGAIEGFAWCSVLFLIVYGYNEEMIDLLQFMSDNVDKVWSLYFSLLAIFIVIAVLMKLGLFILKFDAPKTTRRTRHVEAPKATTTRKATAKKKTTRTTKK